MTEKSNANESESASAGTGQEQGKPSLDDLLASYGKGDGSTDKSESKSTDKGKTQSDADRIAALEQRIAAAAYDAEMAKIIPKIKGDTNLADKYVEFWVNDRAEKDARLRELWDSREANPEPFSKAMEALAEEFAKQHGAESDDEDESRVGNAVRNARKTPAKAAGYDNVDWANLNNEQFELKKRSLFKAAERGELRNS